MSDFWRGRRVFITGHTGFKGAWLSLYLLELGAEVCGYALGPPTQPSLFEMAGLAGRMRSITGNVLDLPAMRRALEEFQPDTVFHMAAQSLVRPSYDDPVETFATNVMGTVNLLEALRQARRPCVAVNVTSDKCYENREWAWGYRENEPMGGHDPYSTSKGCAELVTAAYRRSFFSAEAGSTPAVALASARAGNVIGGGDWALDRLIPDCIRAISAGKPIHIRHPHAVRPWQHVLEPLSGYMLLAQCLHREPGQFAQAWNFGPPETDARPVGWIVEQVVRTWADGASWTTQEDTTHHEATYLKLDSSLARSRLAWRPRLGIDTALAWTLSWYQRINGGEDPGAVTLEQIKEYHSMEGFAG